MVAENAAIKTVPKNNWSNEEFQMISLKDKRLEKRFVKVAESLQKGPLSSINQACGTWADTKAAYRLFNNEKVTEKEILASHQMGTADRMKSQEIVLAVQDTTYLNYSHHSKKQGIGPIGTKEQNLLGLLIHSTLAMTEKGLPLGLITQEIWARAEEAIGEKDKRKKLSIEEKESFKWLKALDKTLALAPEGPLVVTVCDREADIYEFFLKAQERQAKVLIRAAQYRKVEEDIRKLFDLLNSLAVAGRLRVRIPKKGKQPSREATLEVRFQEVKLKAPSRAKPNNKLEPIKLNAILVKETGKRLESLEWMLLTNVKVDTFADAVEKIYWYQKRWGIEVYHKVLKSGLKVEDCRLQKKERLMPYLTLCSIIAWRLYWITKVNHYQPDASCTNILADYEWKPLYCIIHRTTRLPNKLPTVRQVVRWIGQLGGFLGRKGDKEPGVTVIWRGWQRLTDISSTWCILHQVKDVGRS